MGTPKIKKELKLPPEAHAFLVKHDAYDLLLHGKTPKYATRFKAWARSTQGEHLDNLVDALLSSIAYATIVREDDVDFLRGQAKGIILMKEWIKQYASETMVENKGQADDDAEVFNGL